MTEEQDPVSICLIALQTGKDKKGALDAAHSAHAQWWAIDVSNREMSEEEQMELLHERSFVLGAVAAVCVWNGEFEIADRIEEAFLYDMAIWSGYQREVIELYLIHLLFQKQYERIKKIFEDAAFKESFLDYYDLYRSAMDPHYEFQGEQMAYINTLNKVNHYCMQTGFERLF